MNKPMIKLNFVDQRPICTYRNDHNQFWILSCVWIALAGFASGCSEHKDNTTGTASVAESSTTSIEPTLTTAQADPPWFEDVAQQKGIDFTWISGHQKKFFLPQITGGGAALFDMDNDGDLDAYLVQAGYLEKPPGTQPGNQLFRNNGDGTFTNISNGSGADDSSYGMGVTCGDYDNDGDVDLYVTNVGPNILLRNDSNGRFTDVTQFAGVGHPGWGASTAFLDYDADGFLDLYVCNYLNWSVATEIDCYNDMGVPDYCSPQSYTAPSVDVLYHNNGDGTFSDVTIEMGIIAESGTGLGVVCGDFSGDGRADIFVANDGMPDRLWVIGVDGLFHNVANQTSCALDQEGNAKAGMGVAAADIDDDGDLDLIVCNLRQQADSYFRNDGVFFTDMTRRMGLGRISKQYTRFGMGWVDFDNDGYLDLYEATGRVSNESGHPHPTNPFAEVNLLYRGLSGGKFNIVSPPGGTADELIHVSRAAAFGDFDNDGGMDILIINTDDRVYLMHNIASDRGSWIMFSVIDEHERDAYGATIKLQLDQRVITREVRAAYSYMSSNDPRVHIGMGSTDQVTDVTVRWVDGSIEIFGNFNADQIVTLKRGDGRPPSITRDQKTDETSP